MRGDENGIDKKNDGKARNKEGARRNAILKKKKLSIVESDNSTSSDFRELFIDAFKHKRINETQVLVSLYLLIR